jgi:hypothetical protein
VAPQFGLILKLMGSRSGVGRLLVVLLGTLTNDSIPIPAEIESENVMKAEYKFPIDQTTALRRVEAILDGHRQRLETATGLRGIDMVKELRKEFTSLNSVIRGIVERCSGSDGGDCTDR